MEIGKEYEANLKDYLNGEEPEEVKKEIMFGKFENLSDEEKAKLEMDAMVQGAMAMLDISILKAAMHARIHAIYETICLLSDKDDIDDIKMSFLMGQITQTIEVLNIIDREFVDELEKEVKGTPIENIIKQIRGGISE